MKLLKLKGEWWIVATPPGYARDDMPGIGPYSTRLEAAEDMAGLERLATLKAKQISCDSTAGSNP